MSDADKAVLGMLESTDGYNLWLLNAMAWMMVRVLTDLWMTKEEAEEGAGRQYVWREVAMTNQLDQTPFLLSPPSVQVLF